MRLPFFGQFGKKEVKNYFLALLLQDEKVGAVILEEIAGKIRVVSTAEEYFSTSLEKASFEEWLNSIDKAVSLAESSLEEEIQTEKTVFGVKQDWVEDGKIKKEYLLKLKKVCEELALEPIGFLVFTEAIAHLLQQEEGAPVSAILVEVGKKLLTISLIRAGRIIQTLLVPIEEKITESVDKALKNFETEILPTRIILYDGEHNEKLSQAFISHAWSKSLPFLHVPQITVLQPNFDIKGVLYGTASQMGFEVIGEHTIPGKTKRGEIEEIPHVLTKDEEKEATLEDELEKDKDEPGKSSESNGDEELVSGEENIEKGQTLTKTLETVDSDYFGFVENKDVSSVSHKNLPKYKKGIPNTTDEVFEEIPEDVKLKETDFEKPTGGIGAQAGLILTGMKKVFNSAIENLPITLASLKKTFFSKKPQVVEQTHDLGSKTEKTTSIPSKAIIFLSIILAVIIGIILLYVFTLSATVTIALTPKVIDEKSPITFSVDGQSNFDKNQIAAKTISQDESGNLSQDTTGAKQVGTQAKGAVTIFSRLTSTTSLKKGTGITASNNLQFTLDSDVTIASFSGDTSDPSVTVANVAVTAKDIGPEYNLPSGTKFNIDSLDKTDISGKNDDPFSNGTKKDIRVVSKDDADKLLTSVTKNLESNATDDMKKQIDDSKELLSFFAKEDIVKKALSKNIGDEAKSVSVDATITYTGIVVDKNELASYAQLALKDQLSNYADMGSSKLQTNLTDTKQDKNTISGNLEIKAFLLPKIDKNQISKSINGKSFGQAEQALKNISQVSSVQIKLSPNLPFLPKILPRIGSHIQINILTDE